jgi:hypothetical protein
MVPLLAQFGVIRRQANDLITGKAEELGRRRQTGNHRVDCS